MLTVCVGGNYMGTKKNNKKSEELNGVSVFLSLKTKIALMLIFGAVLAAITLLVILVPVIQNLIKEQTKNYMYDVTISNGAVLETMDSLEDAEALKNTFSEVGVKGIESSYAYIVAADGTMLYHPTAEKIGQPVENAVVTELVKEVQQGNRPEAKVIEYEFDGAMKYAAYYINENKTGILVVSANEDEIMQPISEVVRIAIISFVVVVLVIAVLGVILTGIYIKPILKVSEIVSKMAQMDFTENEGASKLLKRKDETGVMSRSVSALRNEMIQMLQGIQKQSDELFKASENLDQDATATQKMVEQVESAVGDIAAGATSQAEETQSATENVITMGNMIKETNSEAEQLDNNSEQMRASSDQAMEILKELIQVNERTKSSIEEVYTQTNITNESVQKIKEATVFIASIAEETNLLSLNASIEAARAGEQGKGFAVVASQIQKLAEQSNESANQIDEITNALIMDSTKAVDTIQLVREVMDEQSEKMQKTDEMFKQVNTGVDNAIDSVINITGKTENLDGSRDRIVDVVQNLSAIAQENAASSEETSASITQVSNIVSDISENASYLKDIAYQLEQNIKKIKL